MAKDEIQKILRLTYDQMLASSYCLMQAMHDCEKQDWNAARRHLARIPRNWSDKLDAAQGYVTLMAKQDAPHFDASAAAKTIETEEDKRIQRQLKMLAEHQPTNHLLYPLEWDNECPNCHLGTVEPVQGV